MGAGYWLNPNTGKCVRVETTHDAWVRDRGNAESIGLPQAAYDAVMQFPKPPSTKFASWHSTQAWSEFENISRYTSVQFSAQPHNVKAILRAVATALTEVKLHPDTMLVIDNLLLHDSARIALGELESHLDKDQPVLREQRERTDGPSVPG